MLQVRVLPGLENIGDYCGFKRCVNSVRRIFQFFRESYAELRKVSWPSREEVGNSTRIVLISVALIALVLGLIDFVFFQAIDLLF